ncbi:MFS transporter [Altererythrobacter sp. KTW20L]|uniref:MFS transporter n=1 Tax=Altererythrobacter sp. KTW20L TaxID=2942210 RepID=UPI0020C0AE65|nr:MFS transporter [Altererythrobacter sp. KTW20L]MCL6250338.1 MFS transporter [Altererythrobacter sp. KTW20L]
MFSRRNLVALGLMTGVFVMEGFDIAAMGLVVPRLEGPLGIPPENFGWVFTAILLGLGIGGATIAPLGDRFGRRALIVAGCLATGLVTLATATSTTTTEFLIWRFLTGLALGACLPNVSALSSELAPAGMRATIMAVVSAGIPVGLALAGFAAPAIIGLIEWQGLFYVPGITAITLAFLLWFMLDGGVPQSSEPKVVPSTASEDAGGDPATATKPAGGLVGKLPQLGLFLSPWAFPFAVFASMLALNAMVLWKLNSWLPTILPQAGLSLDVAAQVAGVANLAGLVIGIGASMLMDRWKKGLTLMLLFGSMTASFAVIALTAPDTTRWTLMLMVGVGGANAGGMVLPGLAAYLFPARLLSSAVGMGVLVARLGAFAGPPLGAAMIGAGMPAQTIIGVAAFPAVACVVVALLVSRALLVKGREEARVAASATG